MRRLVMILVLLAALAGCGGEEARDVQPADVDSAVVAGTRPPAAVTEASSRTSAHQRPSLTPRDRRRLRMMAATIEASVKRFDRAVRACRGDASCLDRALAVVVEEQYEPYVLHFYLPRLNARGRDCEALGYAARAIYGFDLGAGQIDGDPAGYGTPERRHDYLALVDGLRSVPSDLRDAAAGCR